MQQQTTVPGGDRHWWSAAVWRRGNWRTTVWPFICGTLCAFALQRKKQTPGGWVTCSMHPGAEIRLKPKSFWYKGLFWSTSFRYLQRVSLGASRTQKCCLEQQGSFRNSGWQSKSQHQEGVSAANRTPNHEKSVRGNRQGKTGAALTQTEAVSRMSPTDEGQKDSRIGACRALGPQETSSRQNWGTRLEPSQQR